MTDVKFSLGKESIATRLFEVGAIKFGAFKLKLHETKPDAPLSPFYLNLRTPDNPKPGPLTPDLVNDIAIEMLRLTDHLKKTYTYIQGLPNAGIPFELAMRQILLFEGIDIPDVRLLVKTQDGDRRKIDGVVDETVSRGATVLLADDLVTEADSKIEAVKALLKNNLFGNYTVVCVDREQGGTQALALLGHEVFSVFRVTDLFGYYLRRGLISQEQHDTSVAYIGKQSA